MAEVSRLTVVWSGFTGAPGYSKFSFMPLADDTARNAAGAALRTFLGAAVIAYMPNGSSLQISPMVDNVDSVSGELLGTAAMSAVPAILNSGLAATAHAAGSGFVITWGAAGVFNGRRIKGRTFVVPAVGVYDTNGTITSAVITNVESAGATLMAAAGADLAVWNRQYDESTHTIPIAGIVTSATSCTVKDMASQLRSRRL